MPIGVAGVWDTTVRELSHGHLVEIRTQRFSETRFRTISMNRSKIDRMLAEPKPQTAGPLNCAANTKELHDVVWAISVKHSARSCPQLVAELGRFVLQCQAASNQLLEAQVLQMFSGKLRALLVESGVSSRVKTQCLNNLSCVRRIRGNSKDCPPNHHHVDSVYLVLFSAYRRFLVACVKVMLCELPADSTGPIPRFDHAIDRLFPGISHACWTGAEMLTRRAICRWLVRSPRSRGAYQPYPSEQRASFAGNWPLITDDEIRELYQTLCCNVGCLVNSIVCAAAQKPNRDLNSFTVIHRTI
jgi:hypothetical protein